MRIDTRQLAYFLLFPMIPAAAISITLFAVLSSFFIGLFFLSLWRSKETARLGDAFLGLLLLYLLMNLLSLSQTNFWPESLRGVLKVARQVALCAGIIYTLDSPEKVKKLYPWFFVTAAVLAMDAFFQGSTGRDFFNGRQMTAYFGESGRLTGPFKHANDFSAYLSLVGILFLGMNLDGLHFLSKKKYFLYLGGFAMTLAALLGSYSRSGWFAFLITAFLMGLIKKSKVVTGAFLVILIWAAFFSPPLIKQRVCSVWDPHGGAFSERSQLWGEAIRMIKKSPLLGLGVNTYSKNEPSYKTDTSDFQYAHNGYLQIAAETGLLGLSSFLAAMIYFLFVSFKVFLGRGSLDPYLRSAGASLAFGIVAFLIHSFFDTDLQSILLVNLLWIAVGFAWAIRKLAPHS